MLSLAYLFAICELLCMTLIEFLTQSELTLRENAKIFGISPSYLSEIRNGVKEPMPDVARRIVKSTGGLVSFAEIYGEPSGGDLREKGVEGEA